MENKGCRTGPKYLAILTNRTRLHLSLMSTPGLVRRAYGFRYVRSDTSSVYHSSGKKYHNVNATLLLHNDVGSQTIKGRESKGEYVKSDDETRTAERSAMS